MTVKAGYDLNAYNSSIPLQKYWQRRRHNIIMGWMKGRTGKTLDAGCGCSRIILDLKNAIGLDIAEDRLKWLEQYKDKKDLVHGSIAKLPFKDNSFDTIICSEVIEHVKETHKVFSEFERVIKMGGGLIIGTPDYNGVWGKIENVRNVFEPEGYMKEHITHYTFESLKHILELYGFEIIDVQYILCSEMIIKARKVGKNNLSQEALLKQKGNGFIDFIKLGLMSIISIPSIVCWLIKWDNLKYLK